MINKDIISKILTPLIFIITPVFASPVDDLQAGFWYEVPNSYLSEVYPDPIPEGYGPESIISTWNGGAFDTKRNRLIVWGGGHLDYAGNEVYAFSLDDLTWTRITDPSPEITVCADYNPDGQPAMPHTYNSLQYLENTDRFVQAGGSSYGDGCPRYSHTNLLNMDSNLPTPLWERGQDHPVLGHTTGRISAYNPSTGYLWVHGTYSSQGAKLARYDPINDTWASYGTVTNLDIYTTADIDPERRLMVTTGYGEGKVAVWDLDQPNERRVNPNTSGDRTLETAQAPGFVFDPIIKKFVGWYGGSSLYILDPETWDWTKINPAAGNTVTPTDPAMRGTFGRFRYSPSKNVYVVVNSTDENVFIYRLTEGIGSLVSVNFSVDFSSIYEGESATLSWSAINADSCIASGAWSGNKAVTGSEIVSPSYDSTYNFKCIGQTGITYSSLSITVSDNIIFTNSFEVILELLDEDFSGYVVNADPNDWFDTGIENSMQQDDNLFKIYDVGGNKAFGTSNTSSTNIHSHYIGAGSETWSDYIYSGRMRIEGSTDNIGVTFYSDYPNSDRYYRLRREGNSDFYISSHGTNCSGNIQTGVTPNVGNWYEFLVDVQNSGGSTNVLAKVWPSGTQEPSTWQVDCSDSSATRLTSGTIGIWGVVDGSDSGDKLWDNLKVVPIN